MAGVLLLSREAVGVFYSPQLTRQRPRSRALWNLVAISAGLYSSVVLGEFQFTFFLRRGGYSFLSISLFKLRLCYTQPASLFLFYLFLEFASSSSSKKCSSLMSSWPFIISFRKSICDSRRITKQILKMFFFYSCEVFLLGWLLLVFSRGGFCFRFNSLTVWFSDCGCLYSRIFLVILIWSAFHWSYPFFFGIFSYGFLHICVCWVSSFK